ncbi:MAG TPA: hypothetical protein VGN97_18405 [Mesorhizobium sp.]|jgi:hypothetical protein|nr:hypothetical protein [Mesorhizobium sp.]
MKKALVDAARRRLSATGKRTRHVDIRRAISDAYYAPFYALAQTCADELIGANKRTTDAWLKVYRALDHLQAKQALQKAAKSGDAEAELIVFAATFSRLQELRHEADYSPRPPEFNRADALLIVDQVERAIADFDRLDLFRKREIAVRMLLRERGKKETGT